MKQVQAVIKAVGEVLGDSFAEGSTIVTDVITPAEKSDVRAIITEGILDGTIIFKGSLDDTALVKRYVNGMVDNHLRKSRLLNGGNVYKPSSTGTKRDRFINFRI